MSHGVMKYLEWGTTGSLQIARTWGRCPLTSGPSGWLRFQIRHNNLKLDLDIFGHHLEFQFLFPVGYGSIPIDTFLVGYSHP